MPGGVTLAVPASFMGKWRCGCAQQLPPGMLEKQITNPKYKGFRAAHLIAHPDEILNTLETRPGPIRLKMAWFYATNGIANTTNAQGKRWYKALQEMNSTSCRTCS